MIKIIEKNYEYIKNWIYLREIAHSNCKVAWETKLTDHC